MVFTLCLAGHLSAALTALTLISGFSCDVNDKTGIVFIWQERGCFREVIQCLNPLLLRLKVCFHITLVSMGDPFPSASSEVFLTTKMQRCPQPQISQTFLLHCELSL